MVIKASPNRLYKTIIWLKSQVSAILTRENKREEGHTSSEEVFRKWSCFQAAIVNSHPLK